MSDKGENSIAFPANRYGGVIDHISDNVPIMFRSIPRSAMIETMVGRS
jgi:hypothetical protein